MVTGLTQKRDVPVIRDEGSSQSALKEVFTPEADLVRRIVATPAFVRSALLTRFLLYICDRKFAGHADEITEYQIGVKALGRPATYNPGEDNIVRNYARILRKKLDEYFAGDGQDEPTRIVIPVGHYVPVFEANRPRATSTSEEDRVLSGAAPMSRLGRARLFFATRSAKRLLLMSSTALVILAACLSAVFYFARRTQSHSVNEVFWKQIFNHNRAIYLVPGDLGFATLQDIAGKEVHLNDYISGDLNEKFPNLNAAAFRKGANFGPERFTNSTSTADLSIALNVHDLAQQYGGHLLVRYARDMHMEDFKGATIILVGGPHANPWDELFEPESNFRMYFPMHLDGMHIDERSFINKHPLPGEQPSYSNKANESSRLAYTLISFLPGTDSGGQVLMLQGQNMPGTQAAGDFLIDPQAMEPVLKKAQLPDGSIGPFEVLLEARAVGANAAQSRIAVERFGSTNHSE